MFFMPTQPYVTTIMTILINKIAKLQPLRSRQTLPTCRTVETKPASTGPAQQRRRFNNKIRWCCLPSCIYMSARLVQTQYHTDKNTMDEVHRSRIIACPMRSSMSTEPRTWAPKPRPATAWHPSKFCMGLPIKAQAFVGQRRLTTA